MSTFQFDSVLQGRKWLSPGIVTVDAAGKILKVSNVAESVDEKISGWAIPGFHNAHSHAFQYAMAGLAEHLGKGARSDDFWSWRELMYDIANSISPDQMQSIATMAFAEMLRFGFTSVAEFHYLHQDPKGHPYSNPAEMGDRLAAAARNAGINLTLVPVFYRWGDFKKPAEPKQKRFLVKSVDEYFKLVDAYEKNQEFLGIGVHSLRAASPEETKAILGVKSKEKHIHIAEQEKEVLSCKKSLKARPIDWLIKNVDVDDSFHLVHCTHANAGELKKLAQSKATVVLCPSTEGNLGDGLFSFAEFTKLGGKWSIGTDSHVGLNPLEELRWLDYGSRMALRKRNPTCAPGSESGQVLYERASHRGFRVGDFFDAVVVESNKELLSGVKEAHRLSTLIFAGDPSWFKGTIVRGKWRVKDGRHVQHESFSPKFRSAVQPYRS